MKQTFFDSLEDLVAYYKGPNTGLACPLVHAIAKCEEEDEDTGLELLPVWRSRKPGCLISLQMTITKAKRTSALA